MSETTADKLERLANALKDIKAAIAAKNPDPPITNLPLSAWVGSIESLPVRKDPTPEEFKWTAKPLSGLEEDVITDGTLVMRNVSGQLKKLSGAKNYGTVNGVEFGGSKNADGGMTCEPYPLDGSKDNGDSDAGRGGASGTYGNLLKAVFNTDGRISSNYKFTIHDLNADNTYKIQYILHTIGPNGTEDGLSAKVKDDDGTEYTVRLGSQDSANEWYHGATLIRTFKPEASGEFSLDIRFVDTNGDTNAVVNAFQVRDITPLNLTVMPDDETNS